MQKILVISSSSALNQSLISRLRRRTGTFFTSLHTGTNCLHGFFLADHAARSTIGYWHDAVVCPSVCMSLTMCRHCGVQGRCKELKVVPSCS